MIQDISRNWPGRGFSLKFAQQVATDRAANLRPINRDWKHMLGQRITAASVLIGSEVRSERAGKCCELLMRDTRTFSIMEMMRAIVENVSFKS